MKMKHTTFDDEHHELEDLERELRALSPRAPSPLLHQRIADTIDAPQVLHRWYAPLATAAALLICAALMAALLSLSHDASLSPVAKQTRVVTLPLDLTQPTLIAYRHALADSEKTLNELLDDHARRNRKNTAARPAPSALRVNELPSL